MAGFTQAECLAFIKNDTKILILYVSMNNSGGKKFRNFYQFCTWFIDYNMVKVAQGEVSKRPGNVFYS